MTENEKIAEARRLLTDAPRTVANWLRLMALRKDEQACDVIDANIKSVYYWIDSTKNADWTTTDVIEVPAGRGLLAQPIGKYKTRQSEGTVFEVVCREEFEIPLYEDETGQSTLREIVDTVVDELSNGSIATWQSAFLQVSRRTSGKVSTKENIYSSFGIDRRVKQVLFVENDADDVIRVVEDKEPWAWSNRHARF